MLEKFKRFFTTVTPLSVEKKSASTTTVSVAPGSFLEFAIRGGERITASQAMEFYRKNSSIATAIDLIAGSVEQIQPVLKNEKDKLDKNHEVIDLLRNPNGFQIWAQFIGEVARHYLAKHDSHIFAVGSLRLPPIELFPMKPQNISVLPDIRDGFPDKYIVPMGIGKGTYGRAESLKTGARFYDGNLKELYHIMGFSSRVNSIEGDSPIEAAALSAKQQIESSIHNLQILRHGGRLSLIFSFKDGDLMGSDQHAERKKQINEDFAGSDNAGKIAVTSGAEVEIKEVGKTNKDMDFVKLLEIAERSIYLRYNIPLPLVTIKASTFNNMRTGIEMLYDLAVLPLTDYLLSNMSKFLLPRFGLDPSRNQITYDPDTITALMDRRLEQLKKRKDVNIETINELRTLLPNREPIEGGDTLYQAANQVPVGQDLYTEDNLETADEKAARLLKRDGYKTN